MHLFRGELAEIAEHSQGVDGGIPWDRRINLQAALPIRERMDANLVFARNDDWLGHPFSPMLSGKPAELLPA
jgi:hypothetical protein